MEKHPVNLRTTRVNQHALLLQSTSPSTSQAGHRRLVLLHGAGIAGELTWTYVANYLDGWSEILIPDFAGMGKSSFIDCDKPTINDYAQQIEELLTALDWWDTDLVGYSFGGMVATELVKRHAFGLLYLLEPALLSGDDAAGLQDKEARYAALAQRFRQGDDGAYRDFLDVVSPNRRRNPTADKVAMKRLQANRPGLSQALGAVSESLGRQQAYYLDWTSPLPGMSLVGELSAPEMKQRQLRLEQQSSDWIAQGVAGADHSLVFTHPKQVARLMNDRLALALLS
ncbi:MULTISPECIES: alpha/beta fold hydrolase [unclassified Oceanobacter]|uniref:alpha/beta hydrolase n=1 Tax=unclassified Oceanobacter TaxID=2620260 RepID=UPI0026E3D2A8|nr:MULTISPECIES: alpha/beta hydrolase [unclassified Oceanobacter]MDO6681023.1 alpha/beta hydrolase [Oceanobacter sp. 5_MG-2023]MDP2504405.1 alpha/beta hydrolase [Oceanobacter sp. 3_MG-2023]MDP2548301.1 alpha/beta hydrolase [Oceanobacter sp. 4_MG-2023]MDP2608684.1 alpha/beta hydrolase [Oceanobacter sp. 1_MG-2023]MDP2611780.1 alpha/beta hydrolase [Oceanobacter sp. 2_MG-2023]